MSAGVGGGKIGMGILAEVVVVEGDISGGYLDGHPSAQMILCGPKTLSKLKKSLPSFCRDLKIIGKWG